MAQSFCLYSAIKCNQARCTGVTSPSCSDVITSGSKNEAVHTAVGVFCYHSLTHTQSKGDNTANHVITAGNSF